MLHFDSDYMEGAIPAIIERLTQTNFDQTAGYGTDEICKSARDKIAQALNAPDAAISFLVGGTQANAVVLDQILEPWEGVISASTGHINGHEAGAVEGLGHKILPLPSTDGKLVAADVRALCEAYFGDANREHMVAPGVVYLSQPTEYGTLYSLAELEALSAVCDTYDLALFVDGARLGYALGAPQSSVALPDLARLCDAFYIGGTKVGALFGEAVVFPRPQTCRHRKGEDRSINQHFFTITKKRGALLAKGRMLGIQFDELFSANEEGGQLRYLEAGKHGVTQAQRLAQAFREKGYELALDSPTNQLFPVLDDQTYERLGQQVSFSFWERTPDGRTITRFACSWATRPEDVDALIQLL